MARSLKKIHIVDIESTCWKDGAGDKPESPSGTCRPNEIIEIGIARLILDTLEIDKVEQYYTRPKWHPQLSEFCTELTGIEQDTVDAAPEYPVALREMREDFGKNALKSNPWMSWGDYDRVMFEHMKRNVWAFPPCGEKDPDYLKNMYPWGRQHINLKTMHGLLSGAKKGIGVSGALVSIGEKFEGRPHCGRDDAFNIAKIIRYILRENRLKLHWWNI